MNHELAKKLEDATFPKQGFFVCTGCYFQTHEIPHVENEPTLSELIEACGESYANADGLYEFMLLYSIDVWFASFVDGEFLSPKNLGNGSGPTPEEAVANLWIELNKK